MSGQHDASIAALLRARRGVVANHADLRVELEYHQKRIAELTAEVDKARAEVAQYEATLALLGHVDPPHPLNPES